MRAFLLLLLLVAAPVAAGEDPGYVLHEWGTFTTLADSDGVIVSGIHYDEEALPKFVYRRSALANDSYPLNLKMETPVIYIYSDRPRDLQVVVQFPKGLMTEWYPVVSGLMPAPAAPQDTGAHGLLCWRLKVLQPNKGLDLAPRVAPDAQWIHARRVDANMLRVEGPDKRVEHERFLFYRGLGNFKLPTRVSMAEGAIVFHNGSKKDIRTPYFVHVKNGRIYAKMGEGVAPGASSRTPFRLPETTVDKAMKVVETQLLNTGLYDKEARAMVNTWRKSYFETEGLRALYLMTQDQVDAVLPLSVNPKPREIVRVLLTRLDLLTPEQEREAKRCVVEKVSPEEARERLGRFAKPIMRHFSEDER